MTAVHRAGPHTQQGLAQAIDTEKLENPPQIRFLLVSQQGSRGSSTTDGILNK